jgi:hypothetical protein
MKKADETSGTILFEETQSYPAWVMWVIVGSMVLAVGGVVVAAFTSEEETDVWIGLAVIVPVAVITIYLVSKAKLEKIVTSNGFYYRWKPLHGKYRVIEKEDIDKVELRSFPFLTRGFGWFPGYGWYHIAARGEGVQFFLNNGGRRFFSSADNKSFESALKSIISSKS